ncbi:hypothetical protein K7X08_003394 [Anisodus acutangulus]|uniref:Uncharacterized protein n=1 Tax=Anisodus acutangulus TaxID=402998 RepID=A0A9Q1RJM2_9SOLA|nr:hypothetical protein K7X08_003394 [Anisodus acutangulus]
MTQNYHPIDGDSAGVLDTCSSAVTQEILSAHWQHVKSLAIYLNILESNHVYSLQVANCGEADEPINMCSNLGCYNVAEAQSSYVTYFPAYASTSTNGQIFLNDHRSSSQDDHNIQCLNLFGEDWGMNLSLQFGAAAHVIETTEKKSQEEDLDLELRLGHA